MPSHTSVPKVTISSVRTITAPSNRSIRRLSPGTGGFTCSHGRSGSGFRQLIFRGIPFYKTVALNGTPLPVNNRYGIPPKSFAVTLKGIARTGIEAFNRRTFGDFYDTIAPWLETRPFEEKYEELANLFDASAKAYRPSITWSEAVIGLQDIIFPPDNVKAYWTEESPATEVQLCPGMPHYPYADPAIVLSRLHTEQPMQSRRHER